MVTAASRVRWRALSNLRTQRQRMMSGSYLVAVLAMWPDAPPIGSVPPDFAKLGELSEKLQGA